MSTSTSILETINRIHELRIVVLIPAYNEANSIAQTLEGVMSQTRLADRVVVIPNGCTDDTASIARRYPVKVLELPVLENKKSEALNIGWSTYCYDADVVVCLDADTWLPSNAIADWEEEMIADSLLGGSSSKFTMPGGDMLTRLQRAEFAKWTDASLKRGWTSVLAGTGCAIRNTALEKVVRNSGHLGPWSYESQVEDFLLTYQIRKLGYGCSVSPTVRAYTDSMKTVRSLWGQRMKWQVGTVEDLLSIGVNRLTLLDWGQQAFGLFSAALRVAWATLMILFIFQGMLVFTWYWWVVPPLIFIANDVKSAMIIPHRDKRDIILAASLLPQEAFAWMRAAWFTTAWLEVLAAKVTGNRRDHWKLQYTAESR